MKATRLSGRFQQLKARRGPKKTIIAIARSILVAIYHMLKSGETYRDRAIPPRADPSAEIRRLLNRLQKLGYHAMPVVSFLTVPIFTMTTIFSGARPTRMI